jgi:hypothetical protein
VAHEEWLNDSTDKVSIVGLPMPIPRLHAADTRTA